MPKISITDSQFNATSRHSGSYPHNSPVFFILQCPLTEYRQNYEFIDSIAQEIESNSQYSSLEQVVEKLNKKISKSAAKNMLSLALFQKEGTVVKVAAHPSCVLHYEVSRQTHPELLHTTLSFADTNRMFSEVLEIDTGLSKKLIFSFSQSLTNENHFIIEGNTISTKIQKKESKISRYFRSVVTQRLTSILHVSSTKKQTQKKFFSRSRIKYAIALLIAILAIVGINNAKTNKLVREKQTSDQEWTLVSPAEIQPIINVKEKLSSKYIHEQQGLIRAGNYLFTYQSEPNIILQINEQTKEVTPIVIDSERIGKLNGAKKLTEEILLFSHDKTGLIFLNYADKRWRLVEFKKPKIVEYTDIAVYNDFIYVLDARSRQIWKLEIGEQEIVGISWVSDERVDLSLASSIAIDGSIYLTLINGEVIKMTQGRKDASFSISPTLTPTLANVDKIMIGPEDSVTLLDRIENRLIVLKNNGDFVRQYRLGTILPLDDVVIGGEDIYVLIREEIGKLVPKPST